MNWKCRGCKHVTWLQEFDTFRQCCEYELKYKELQLDLRYNRKSIETLEYAYISSKYYIIQNVFEHKGEKCPFWEI